MNRRFPLYEGFYLMDVAYDEAPYGVNGGLPYPAQREVWSSSYAATSQAGPGTPGYTTLPPWRGLPPIFVPGETHVGPSSVFGSNFPTSGREQNHVQNLVSTTHKIAQALPFLLDDDCLLYSFVQPLKSKTDSGQFKKFLRGEAVRGVSLAPNDVIHLLAKILVPELSDSYYRTLEKTFPEQVRHCLQLLLWGGGLSAESHIRFIERLLTLKHYALLDEVSVNSAYYQDETSVWQAYVSGDLRDHVRWERITRLLHSQRQSVLRNLMGLSVGDQDIFQWYIQCSPFAACTNLLKSNRRVVLDHAQTLMTNGWRDYVLPARRDDVEFGRAVMTILGCGSKRPLQQILRDSHRDAQNLLSEYWLRDLNPEDRIEFLRLVLATKIPEAVNQLDTFHIDDKVSWFWYLATDDKPLLCERLCHILFAKSEFLVRHVSQLVFQGLPIWHWLYAYAQCQGNEQWSKIKCPLERFGLAPPVVQSPSNIAAASSLFSVRTDAIFAVAQVGLQGDEQGMSGPFDFNRYGY